MLRGSNENVKGGGIELMRLAASSGYGYPQDKQKTAELGDMRIEHMKNSPRTTAFVAACMASSALVAPAIAQTRLDTVTFRIRDNVGIGYDLQVFAWDPTARRVTGSSLGSTSGTTPGTGSMSSVVIDTGGVQLPSAGQYVAFLQATSNGPATWGTAGDSYAGNSYVYQNNGGNTASWASSGWAVSSATDMAFALAFNFGPPLKKSPPRAPTQLAASSSSTPLALPAIAVRTA
jgi:hypothetical protein